MFDKNLTLNDVDPDIAKVISAEEARQEAHIELIASENYTSPAVMYAQGCQMTNKYAEGYLVSDTMVAVSMLMLQKLLLSAEQKSFLERPMPMFSHIQAQRLMQQSFKRY